ncbi:hypothetical protein DYB37_011064 [Aphanomyces astaci]|nr:hypothetical protein DYB36_009953 [Aphanomyces astaci]RHY58144.1 hypothetical protein DYB34_009920 [Aphanomyces astaci]RHY76799.1 hypothetical protein DYB30_013730 [Aphanomyces astaci]RHY83727.1 hypothetical protein DYB26_008404 [Aphanomyces astaci]RHY86202.1 hypothetical protein DYB31_007780 [Aphanomyces astaci]
MKPEQWIMGSVFTAMGLATMLFPGLVYEYGFEKEFVSNASPSAALLLMTQCFGSQAALGGLTILSTRWNSTSYRNFGIFMIPYFVFDVYVRSIGAITTLGAVGDGIGNIVFSLCCYVGYTNCKKAESKPLLDNKD